jgi:Protein of unknown function (DUF2934)
MSASRHKIEAFSLQRPPCGSSSHAFWLSASWQQRWAWEERAGEPERSAKVRAVNRLSPYSVGRLAAFGGEQFCGYFVLSLMETAVDQKQIVYGLLAKGYKYRNFARWVGDRETVQHILALADELIQRARALARPDETNIRRRAREIWIDNGQPAGRDEEFWFQAEREIREAEKLANESREDK